MPLYEYQCDACSRRFEVIHKYSDPPADTCPTCGGSVKRLISSPAIQFKGSGWYITDYARAGKSDDGASASKSDSESKSGAEANRPDTKPADSKKADSKKDAAAPSTPSAKPSE